MSLKVNILAALIALMLIALLANAAEDNGNESQISFENSSFNSSDNSAKSGENLTLADIGNIPESNTLYLNQDAYQETEEPNSSVKSANMPVTASFGVYLSIVG